MEFHNKAYKRYERTFTGVEEFRQEGKIKHPLIEILFIVIVATIANADGMYFEDAMVNNFENISVSKKITLEKGHGRIEKREYFQTNDIDWFAEKHMWMNLTSIGMVRQTVTIKDKTTVEISNFISSLDTPKDEECELFAKAVRKHWGVESCHWILDVVFREDDSRARKNNGATNCHN